MRSQLPRIALTTPSIAFFLTVPLAAQGPVFDSPGTPSYANPGQTDQFSREFNPALGVVLDGFVDWKNLDSGGDGFDLQLRLLEINASAWIDPKAWAYIALVSEELESPEFEEAAIEYVGFDGGTTLKAGRFFVDFGKQMQLHLEELRTLERPLPLRSFLGEELAGTGLQVDHWLPLGDETPVRFSLGIFAELLPDGEQESGTGGGAVATVPDQKSIDELAFTARVTAMTDAGERGLFQGGASVRWLPGFEFEFDDGTFSETEEDFSNVVFGADLTYATADETGTKRWVVGGEALFVTGDLAARPDDPVTPTDLIVTDDNALGFYIFADYGWNTRSSVGCQFAMAEDLIDPGTDAHELDLYYTRNLTEFRRLRLGTTYGDSDRDGESWRVFLQFTAFFGNHSHGFNW